MPDLLLRVIVNYSHLFEKEYMYFKLKIPDFVTKRRSIWQNVS